MRNPDKQYLIKYPQTSTGEVLDDTFETYSQDEAVSFYKYLTNRGIRTEFLERPITYGEWGAFTDEKPSNG